MLKTRFLGGIAALALLAGAFPALADNTDTEAVTVSGAIIATLELSVGTNLTMPHLVAPGASGQTNPETTSVLFDLDGEVSYSEGGDPGSDNGNGTETLASLTASGQAGYTFAVDATSGTNFPTGVSFEPDCPADGVVGTAFNCGGELTADSTATAGTFSTGTFDVTVTYN